MRGAAVGAVVGVLLLTASAQAAARHARTLNFVDDYGAVFSPDGRLIVFSGWRGRFKGAGVYAVDGDGRGLQRLSNFAR